MVLCMIVFFFHAFKSLDQTSCHKKSAISLMIADGHFKSSLRMYVGMYGLVCTIYQP